MRHTGRFPRCQGSRVDLKSDEEVLVSMSENTFLDEQSLIFSATLKSQSRTSYMLHGCGTTEVHFHLRRGAYLLVVVLFLVL